MALIPLRDPPGDDDGGGGGGGGGRLYFTVDLSDEGQFVRILPPAPPPA